MKTIVNISTLDRGGAAVAAYRFHTNLNRSGQNSLFFVSKKTLDDDSVVEVKPNGIGRFGLKAIDLLERFARFFSPRYYFFDKGRHQNFDLLIRIEKMGLKPDVIVLHWISGFVGLQEIHKIVKHFGCDVFWYLMDMAPMTGGCHYAWDCVGYTKTCSVCPAVPFYMKGRPYETLQKKTDFIRSTDAVAISPSGQVSQQLAQSTVFKGNRAVEMLIGIDPECFYPDSNANRYSSLNVPVNKRVVLIGASNMFEERKGLFYIIKALKTFKHNWPAHAANLFVLVAGKPDSFRSIECLGFDCKYIGHLRGDEDLARAYQVADFHLSASIEDSGPMMINESVMAGTPVVSFRMGVAEDLIVHGETGYLARLKDETDLARYIYEMMRLPEKELGEMKRRCRRLAVAKSSVKVQIETFLRYIGELN